MTTETNRNTTPSPFPQKQPQIIAFNAGIQVVIRNSDGEVTRIYYFCKVNEGSPAKIIYSNSHPNIPYTFETCWDVRSSIHLSAGFICSEYKSDGLDRLLYQYYAFDVEIESAEKESPIRAQCLLKSSSFSRAADEAMVAELVQQSLPRMHTTVGNQKPNITSCRRASHHDWQQWKSGEIFAIPLNRNGQEIARLRMRNLPELLLPATADSTFALPTAQPAFA